MFDGMLDLEINGLQIAVRTGIVYFALLTALRIAGKREVGQMTSFDLVVIILVANAVQNAMTGPDFSLTGGLIAGGVLIGLNWLLALVAGRVVWIRLLVEGSATVLVQDGGILWRNMRKEGVDQDELHMAIREAGLAGLDNVKLAVLEIDGRISVVPRSGESD